MTKILCCAKCRQDIRRCECYYALEELREIEK